MFFGVRWLAKQIMYLSSSRIMNRIVLREETEYLHHLLKRACKNISKGIDCLREGKQSGYSHIRRGKSILDTISIMLGDDLPLSKLPLLEEVTSLLDALSPLLESRAPTDQQCEAAEIHVADLQSIMSHLLYVPPSFSTFSSYIHYPHFWRYIWSFIKPTNPFFVTFPMLQRRLKFETNCDIFSVSTADRHTVTCFIFSPQVRSSRSSHFVLLASPNACVAECSYRNDSLVRFYTHLGYYVVTYNYRGTGASTGDVTPWNTVSDAETIAHFVSRKYRISPQIIHGTSIGGFVVSQFSDETPILVFDRTFSDMNSLVHCYVHPFLAFLVRVCRRWPMSNISSFNLHRNSLIIFDPQDEIVSFPVSLIVGITWKYSKPDPDIDRIESIFVNGLKVAHELIAEMNKENGIREYESLSDEALLKNETLSPPNKIVLLLLRCYILGIPLNLLFDSPEKIGVSFLIRFMMTWRHHVTSFHFRGNDVDLLMNVVKRPEFASCKHRSMDCLVPLIHCINDCLSRTNIVLPEGIQALAVHCGHNGNLSQEELVFVGELMEKFVSTSSEKE